MKRLISTLAVFLLIFSLFVPQSVQASSKVKVHYKGTSTTYSRKKTYVYINGKKKKLSSTPVFLKSGAFVGPLDKIFKNSSLKVKCKFSGNKVTLTYKKKKLVLTNGSIDVKLNGKKEYDALGAIPMQNARYSGTKTKRWIVPIKSVCRRLGINYLLDEDTGKIYISAPKKAKASAVPAAATTAKKMAATTTVSKTTAATAGQTSTLGRQVVLVIDAGHGGVDSGAVGKLYREKNLTLAIVLGAKKYFDNDSRFKVYYTRVSDTYPSLDDRCKLANNKDADMFICVHINSASSSATGTETLYNNSRLNTTKKNGITSKQLAYAMQKAAVKTTGFTNRGLVNRTGLRVLNKTDMPACLIEYGFISNPKEERTMYANTARYGKELYQALVNYMKAEGKIK